MEAWKELALAGHENSAKFHENKALTARTEASRGNHARSAANAYKLLALVKGGCTRAVWEKACAAKSNW